MRSTSLVLVVLTGGCSFSSPTNSPAIDGPPGVHDTPIDGPAKPGDKDGDGFLDDNDNCPDVANPDQHDEDGDRVGDACDKCPQIANESATDTDGDGIPDACDPDDTKQNTLVAFIPFTGTALPAGWAEVGDQNTYSVVGDDDLTLAAGNGQGALLMQTADTYYTIEIGVDVSKTQGAVSFLEVLTDATADLKGYNSCGVRLDPANRERELGHSTNSTYTPTIDAMNPPTVPGTYRIVMVQGPASESCSIPANLPLTDTFPIVAGRVGVLARNVTAKIHYLALYH